jgi:hypothetical protein
VAHLRRSRRPHPRSNYTPFDLADTVQNFFDKWPEMLTAFYREHTYLFSVWLTVFWNTVWQAGVASQYYIRDLPEMNNSTKAAIAAGKEVMLPRGPLLMNMTTASKTYYQGQHYVCATHWLALLVVASIALLLSGVAGLWAKYTTIAPDILTHASSLTRDNPYIPLPPGGSTLDGVERARALKHVRVRLRDVQPGAPVGHIALALDDDDDTPAAAATTTTTSPDGSGGSRRRRGVFSASQRGVGYLQKQRLYA